MIGMAGGSTKRFRVLRGIAVKKSVLVAGAMIETGLKKVLSKGTAQAKRKGATDVSFEKVKEEDELDELKLPDTEQESEVALTPLEKQTPMTQHTNSSPSNVKKTASASSPSFKSRASHELEIDCLVCENLVLCEVRITSSKRCAKLKQE